MSTEHDNDAELRRVLRGSDPAAHLAPLTPRETELLRERIMRSAPRETALSRVRLRRGWLAGGISAAGAAAAAAIAIPLAVGVGAPSVTALQAPAAGGPAAICAVVTPDALSTVDTAFRADVTSIDGDTVTLHVNERFTGDVNDTVTIPQSTDTGLDGQPPIFGPGQTYLIAARDGFVLGCGLTDLSSPALENIYQDAF